MMNNKHAYLIMAHNEFNILEKLIILLDDTRNDLYIHIDKKVKNFNFNYYNNLVKKSNLYFVERVDTRWGDFSLVECEIILLREAIKNKYKYYHLISGVDLPIKTQDQIHEFFDRNNSSEFIHFATDEQVFKIKERVQYYYFMKWHRNRNKYIRYIGLSINSLLCAIQNKLNIKRKWEKNTKLKFGSQWFSITYDFAKYVIDKEDWINKYFKWTSCSDELFLQTLVYNSRFKDNLYVKEMSDDYKASIRYIDWKRGAPYVFRKDDFKEIINSDRLFARKFSSKIDNEIIENVFDYLIASSEMSISQKGKSCV